LEILTIVDPPCILCHIVLTSGISLKLTTLEKNVRTVQWGQWAQWAQCAEWPQHPSFSGQTLNSIFEVSPRPSPTFYTFWAATLPLAKRGGGEGVATRMVSTGCISLIHFLPKRSPSTPRWRGAASSPGSSPALEILIQTLEDSKLFRAAGF
jgi:hypothetical protein